jgi:hypothetical protein
MLFRDAQVYIEKDKSASFITALNWSGKTTLPSLESLSSFSIIDHNRNIGGKDCIVFTCNVSSTSGKSIPFGCLRWFQDEGMFVFPFKNNPSMGLVAYDLSKFVPSTSSRERVSTGLLMLLDASSKVGIGLEDDGKADKPSHFGDFSGSTKVQFSKHPLFLILVKKYFDEIKKDMGKSFTDVMHLIVDDKKSIVYQYAEQGFDLAFVPMQPRLFVLTSTFAISENTDIISGSSVGSLIKDTYAAGTKVWKTATKFARALPGDGFERKSIRTITACQWSSNNGVKIPAALIESDLDGRVVTDIMEGSPEFFGITDPQSLSRMYEEDVVTGKMVGDVNSVWDMHRAVMTDFYNNLMSQDASKLQGSLGQFQLLIKKAGYDRMVSGQLKQLMISAGNKEFVNTTEMKNIRYLDVICRLLQVKAAKVN